jgi:hypothetical protein
MLKEQPTPEEIELLTHYNKVHDDYHGKESVQ